MSAIFSQPKVPPVRNETPALAGAPGPTGEYESCRTKRGEQIVQRSAIHSAPPTLPNTWPLLPSRFGHDFSLVQTHAIHATAESGTRTARDAMPHAEAIQRSFGHHSVGEIRAQIGGAAVEATHALGAVAYAFGNKIAFGRAPDLHTTAHEAAHVIQQRAGVNLPAGMGKSGDRYEQHADAVASLVAQGQSAELLLDLASGSGSTAPAVQRLAFVNETRITKNEKDFTPEMRSMVSDSRVRNYTGVDEFKKHAGQQTDYLGNLADGTWLRFSPTGTNLLGENHTEVTLEQVVPVVGTKSFIYEPFSSDTMAPGSNFQSAYAGENKDRFNRFGVGKEKDKQQFGAESLLPKMGYNLTLLQPYFDGTEKLSDLASGQYFGQPAQRYLKIAWGWSKDKKLDVEQKLKAGIFVPPKFKKLAQVHAAVEGKLDKFIPALVVDGHLGDELGKKANAALLPLLAQFGRAFSEAMVREAAAATSSRLSMGRRSSMAGSSVTSEKDKLTLFTEWRDFMFEDNVKAATKRGVRYAGMGQAHLDHLVSVGLDKNQHPFEMEGKDIKAFRDLTKKLKPAAKKP